MKKLKTIMLAAFIVVFLVPVKAFTQSINPLDYNIWSVGIKYGLLPFYGDVRQLKYSSDNTYKKTNSGIALEGIRNFNEIFGAKLQLMKGSLSGSSPNLNLHFNGSIMEYSLSGMVNVNNLISFYPQKDKLINAYLFAGFGMASFRSAVRTYDEDTYVTGFGWDSLGLSKTSKKATAIFPFGIGIKFKADSKFDIGLELTLHLTKSDGLDAWAVENSYNDRYSYVAISFIYKLGDKEEYVDWVNPFRKADDDDDNNDVLARNSGGVNDNPNTPNSNTNTSRDNVADDNNNAETNTNTEPSTRGNSDEQKVNNTKNRQKKVSDKTEKSADQPVKKDTNRFYIIYGAYKNMKQANSAVLKLQKKGYPNAEVVDKNKTENIRICYRGYVTKEEAVKDLKIIKKENPKAKLYEKKVPTTPSAQNKITVTTTQNKPPASTEKTQPKTTTPENKQDTTKINIAATDSSAKTTTAPKTETPKTEAPKTETQKTETPQPPVKVKKLPMKNYYVVADSFPSEDQAKEHIAMLMTMGFPEAELAIDYKTGNWYACYKGYNNKKEALLNLEGIKQSTDPSAWLYDRKK